MMDKMMARTARNGRGLEWTGPMSKGIPVFRVTGFRELIAARRLVLLELGPIEPGKLASMTCGNPVCVARAHVRPMTRTQAQRVTARKNGYHKNPVRSAKIAAKAKARRVLTDEQAAMVRTDPRPLRAVAKELGVNFSVVQGIRSGRTYRDGNPWGGLLRL